jgi:predicted transcriptional regulator
MLTPLELDVMKAVWRRPPITVREAQEAIRPGRQLAYTTVMTIMDRLFHKGFLTRTLQSRTHFYEPAIGFNEVRDEAVETLIRRFFGSKEELKKFLDGEEGEDRNDNQFIPRADSETSSGSWLDETLL